MRMQHISRMTLLVLVAVLFSAAMITSASAAPTDFAVSWWTTAPSGRSEGGAFVVEGSSGQADAGVLSGGSYALPGGFWQPATAGHAAYLPMVTR